MIVVPCIFPCETTCKTGVAVVLVISRIFSVFQFTRSPDEQPPKPGAAASDDGTLCLCRPTGQTHISVARLPSLGGSTLPPSGKTHTFGYMSRLTARHKTEKRHCSIIDPLWHKNMITGADVRKAGGIQGQTRQHSRLINLLRVRQSCSGVHKVDCDTAEYKQERYNVSFIKMKSMLTKAGGICRVRPDSTRD